MDKPILSPEEVQILQGGAAGIGLQALFNRKTLDWWVALTILLSGGSLAWFGTPIVVDHFHLTGDEAFVSLMLAFGAPFVFGGFLTAGKDFQASPLSFVRIFISRWWPVADNPPKRPKGDGDAA